MTIPPFNYPLMEMLCKELQERVINFNVIHCLPNDLRRFWIILSEKEKQEALFFSFTPPFSRFHLTRSPAISKNLSSHPLSPFLQNATLKRVELLQHDRILQLTFLTTQGERRLIAEFFSKHPNYYLVKLDGTILFALHALPKNHYELPPPRPALPAETPLQWHSHREVEQAYAVIEEKWKWTQEKQAISRLLSKQLKQLEKKEQILWNNLKQCAQWTTIQHEGDLIKSHLSSIKKGIATVCVHDWMTDQPYELKLNPAKTPQEEMAARYKQARKLQTGQAPLTHHLERTQEKISLLKQQQQRLQLTPLSQELAAFKKTLPLSLQPRSVAEIPTPSSPIYREYQSCYGVKIWVGKNAKANDRLTFQLANGRDWWLHVNGTPGSHVIIRLGKDQEPDSETLKDAMQLALHYSKARDQGEGEICFTQRKYVTRLGKEKTGLVQISKHQRVWIRLDPVRLQALKDRLNKDS